MRYSKKYVDNAMNIRVTTSVIASNVVSIVTIVDDSTVASSQIGVRQAGPPWKPYPK